MPKYVIEREIPGAGKITTEQLDAILETSCGVLSKMNPLIQWVHSYVTANKIYCIYKAPSEKIIREQAWQAGFTASVVTNAATINDPLLWKNL